MATKQRPSIGLTKREYLDCAGQRCPKCKSTDIHSAPRLQEGEDGKVRRAMRCYDCGRYYYEVYTLAGWEED